MSDRPRVGYAYAYLRLVPRVHLERFHTLGLLLHAPERDFIGIRYRFDREALAAACPGLDLDMAERAVRAYAKICAGEPGSEPLGLLPPAERFHWLAAPRSTVLQSSRPHTGMAEDPEAVLEQLFEEIKLGTGSS